MPADPKRLISLFFAVLALGLLAATLAWHIPMMLWDHLDLVPLYKTWLDGSLHSIDLVRVHGGHLHSAAYAVLLITTGLSGGQPWLDCVVSWFLLVGYAALISVQALRIGDNRSHSLAIGIVVLLALYPGHLSNLQWGWQVAVFLCLLGIVGTVSLLTRDKMSPAQLACAIACSILACLSFAIGVAILPVAALLLGVRNDISLKLRIIGIAAIAAFALCYVFLLAPVTDGHASLPIGTTIHYILNFLGSGIVRFATDLAPWVAAAAIVSGAIMAIGVRHDRHSRCWLAYMLVVLLSSFVVAYGRVDAYGADQAFVTRYVSFSSLFWIGWAGLAARYANHLPRRAGLVQGALVVVALCASFNALHLMKKAAEVAHRARETAAEIRRTYPLVAPATLSSIYFDQPDIAKERLDLLKAWGFAPFD
jgi:hypothetical protein